MRAAGLACDALGDVERVEVELTGSERGARAARAGGRVRVELDARVVRGSAPDELLDIVLRSLDRARKPDAMPPRPGAPAADPGRVVLFENPFSDPDRDDQGPRSMACGTFQLASALRADGIEVVVVPGKLDRRRGITDVRPLKRALGAGCSLVCITLLEGCFEASRALVERIRGITRAPVACGGPMVTLTPCHAAAHMDGASLFVRGPGEGVLPGLVRLLAGRVTGPVIESLMSLDGILLLRGGLLVAGHAGRLATAVPDETAMDFSLYEAHHLGGGLSIETSRGCTNPCQFCTSPGKGTHAGRSGDVVARHLAAYEERLVEIFGSDVPRPARRVHICDDDFTCDPGQAIEVLGAVERSGLSLSSFQASVRDFMLRTGGRRSIDEKLLDAIKPGLFQDADRFAALALEKPRGRPPADVASFVHLGIEALGDADLRRLGKGYRPEDAFAVVAALDERDIVHDAYLILSGPGTTLDDLATTLLGIMKLKLEHPHTFFIRIPVVPFVVPVFPSDSYRTWQQRRRRGEADGEIESESVLRRKGFPELEYPIVKRGIPSDVDVREACEAWEGIVEPDPHYFRPAANLEAWLRRRLPSIKEEGRAARVRRVIRRLSGAGQLAVYSGIARARRNEIGERAAGAYWNAAAALGPAERVAREARNLMEVGDPRLVVIPTRDCSLRCTYCPMDKEPGKHMGRETLEQAIELLVSSASRNVILQFFGGEALLRKRFVLDAMDRALVLARDAGKHIGFILSTNGVSLDEELVEILKGLPVKVEVSIDGTRDVHNHHRRPADRSFDSYETATSCARALIESSIPHEVIMVVTPATVERLGESFDHVASLGFRKIQVNHALAVRWSKRHKEAFARELARIEKRHYSHRVGERGAEMLDLRTFRKPMLLNGEITVDHDGTVFYGNGFLVRTARPERFRAGHLDDLENMDAYLIRRLDNDTLIEHTYPPDVARNNIQVGRIFASFVNHMRARFPELAVPEPVRSPGHPR